MVQFQSDAESFSFLSWKTKKFYSKKKNIFMPLSISKQKSFVCWPNFQIRFCERQVTPCTARNHYLSATANSKVSTSLSINKHFLSAKFTKSNLIKETFTIWMKFWFLWDAQNLALCFEFLLSIAGQIWNMSQISSISKELFLINAT